MQTVHKCGLLLLGVCVFVGHNRVLCSNGCTSRDAVWYVVWSKENHSRTHKHTRLTAHCPWLPRWAGTRKVKPIWILLKQVAVAYAGLHLAPYITTSAPHHTVFSKPDALPADQQRQSTEGTEENHPIGAKDKKIKKNIVRKFSDLRFYKTSIKM